MARQYPMVDRDPLPSWVSEPSWGPADRLLQTVSTRAPDGFERIEDVLGTAELAAFDHAYRSTTLPDVAALNSRPSLSVTSR